MEVQARYKIENRLRISVFQFLVKIKKIFIIRKLTYNFAKKCFLGSNRLLKYHFFSSSISILKIHKIFIL